MASRLMRRGKELEYKSIYDFHYIYLGLLTIFDSVRELYLNIVTIAFSIAEQQHLAFFLTSLRSECLTSLCFSTWQAPYNPQGPIAATLFAPCYVSFFFGSVPRYRNHGLIGCLCGVIL